MIELILEIVGYLGAAALIGIFLGYLIWGWGQRERIASARADGAARARTSGFGDPALSKKLDIVTEERDELTRSIETLEGEIDRLRSEAANDTPEAADGTDETAEDGAQSPKTTSRLNFKKVPASDDSSPQRPEAPVLDREPDRQPAGESPLDEVDAALEPRVVERRRAQPDDARGSAPESVDDDSEFMDADIEMIGDADDDSPDDDEPHGDLSDEDIEDTLADVLETLRPEPVAKAANPGETDGAAATDGAAVERPKIFLGSPPEEPDDLQRIRGVGAKMESLLNRNGVYQYRQIASFSEDDIDWLNNAIAAFPGRIRRDNWVEQARSLHQEKFGQPHDAN